MRILLSVMILDFFGTFFSSANTLLPFVAMDILHVGPIQYGWLSAAQSIGTLMVAVYLSQKTNLRRQGLPVPEIFTYCREEGWFLLEDLGDVSLQEFYRRQPDEAVGGDPGDRLR